MSVTDADQIRSDGTHGHRLDELIFDGYESWRCEAKILKAISQQAPIHVRSILSEPFHNIFPTKIQKVQMLLSQIMYILIARNILKPLSNLLNSFSLI